MFKYFLYLLTCVINYRWNVISKKWKVKWIYWLQTWDQLPIFQNKSALLFMYLNFKLEIFKYLIILYVFQDTRQKLTQLSSVHLTLKKLQFLFRLPHTLKKNLEDGSYGDAVRNYTQAIGTLRMYDKTPSFSSIQKECDEIMESVKDQLMNQLSSKQVCTYNPSCSTYLVAFCTHRFLCLGITKRACWISRIASFSWRAIFRPLCEIP